MRLSTAETAGLAVVAVATVWLHLLLPVPSDVGWLLSVNEKLLAGQRLYAEVLETNPPMAVWLYWTPVLLEHLTGARAEGFAVIETVGAGLLSLGLARAILGDRPLAGVPIAAAAAVVLLLPLDAFAQREHFVLFGLMPWLASAIRRDAGARPGTSWSIVAGCGLAVALAIKPHFAIVAGLVALAAVVRRRSLRPALALENWIAAGLLLAYGAVILIVYPDFADSVLPAASVLYVPLRMDTGVLLLQPHAVLVYLALLLAAAMYRGVLARDEMPLLLTAIVGCLLVYLVQGKGWGYHLLPGTSLAVLLVVGLARATRGVGGRWAAAAFVVLCAAAPATWAATMLLRPEPLLALARYGSGRTVELISSDIGLGSPVVRQLGDTLSNSSPMLWRATGAINLTGHAASNEAAAVLKGYEAEDYRLLAKDLATRPDLVLADTQGYDWLAWARRDAAVAHMLESYSPDGAIGTHGTTVIVLKRK